MTRKGPLKPTEAFVIIVVAIAILSMAYIIYPTEPTEKILTPGGGSTIASYYLQNITPEKIEWHNWTILVLEPEETTSQALMTAKARSGLVLAYINAGYAEEWRNYWETLKDTGIVHGKTMYEGEYYVEYWSPAWRETILDMALEYLSHGYQGVYLDNIDAADQITMKQPGWADGLDPYAEMIRLVSWVSQNVKLFYPDAYVFVNIGSATQLLYNQTFLHSIDGVLREELWTKWTGVNETAPVPVEEVNDTLRALIYAKQQGLVVIVADPVKDRREAETFCAKAHHYGFIPVPQPAWSPDYSLPPLPDWCNSQP